MTEEEKKDLALFRYSLIAPIVAGTYQEASKSAYYRSAAAREYTLPDGRRARFSAATIKKWYLKYMDGKLDALTPGKRKDSGCSRALTGEMEAQIQAYKKKFPHITGVKIREKMIADGHMKPSDASLDTIYRYLRSENLSPGGMQPQEVLAFEFEHANDCWQADTVDGPWIRIDGVQTQTYLITFLDDASRLIVHGELYLADNALNMQDAFKKAIRKFGLPRRCFDDNGSPYKNRQISMICAQLGIQEIHSRPYLPRGKGKEERSHRTAKQKWMDCTDFSGIGSLDELNHSYWEFLDKEYNNYPHSSIGMTPRERYLKDFDLIKFAGADLLDEAFLHRTVRKVSQTACVSLFKTSYEVEQKFIGKKVGVRYHPEDLSCIYIYDDASGERLCTGHPVRKTDNAKRKRRANISYGQMDGGGCNV